MRHTLNVEIACISLFVGMSLVSMVFYRLGRRGRARQESPAEVSGAIIGAVFGLMGLLIAFAFYGAWSRLDARRQLIVEEANAIGTAYTRLDLLPASAQDALRVKFREYSVSRASLYEKLADEKAARAELAKAIALEREIWTQAVTASSGPGNESARMLLIPALNGMFDVVTTRTVAIQTHPPVLVYALLFAIALACAALTGHRAGASERFGYLYNALLAAIIACVLYVTLDIEYPRYGLMRLDQVNQTLVELAETMK